MQQRGYGAQNGTSSGHRTGQPGSGAGRSRLGQQTPMTRPLRYISGNAGGGPQPPNPHKGKGPASEVPLDQHMHAMQINREEASNGSMGSPVASTSAARSTVATATPTLAARRTGTVAAAPLKQVNHARIEKPRQRTANESAASQSAMRLKAARERATALKADIAKLEAAGDETSEQLRKLRAAHAEATKQWRYYMNTEKSVGTAQNRGHNPPSTTNSKTASPPSQLPAVGSSITRTLGFR